jgi:predicted hydrocarbon binding protein
MVGPNRSERTIQHWTGHHVLLCETTAEALGVMHEMMGLKSVTVARTMCVDRGSPECRFVISWDAP